MVETSEVLCETAGWVLFSDDSRLVFADRGTSYRRVVMFVAGLITVILGANGLLWLGLGIREGKLSTPGIVLVTLALLGGFGVSRMLAAEKRERLEIPSREDWVAVIDLESRKLETAGGETLAPLSSVRFVPVMQFGSSAKALAAKWPGGSKVIYRGHPFASSIRPALDVLESRGVTTGGD